MKTLAIIAEYNPFHNGHKYHLETSKATTGADYALTVMSGNFLQRGFVAIADKYTRARMCTLAGLDLALELPFPYATGSAMDFSMGAVSLIDKLNTVDYLCFGAETPDLHSFEKIADILIEEPDNYSNHLKNYLSKGMSFPAARQQALIDYSNDTSLTEFIASPNNILGIEYVCALKKLNSPIKPVPILRKKAGYHDKNIYGNISSATAIRENLISSDHSLEDISKDIPETTLALLKEDFNKTLPVFNNSLTPFLQASLFRDLDFENICDISREFSNKLCNLPKSINFEEAVASLKSKDITTTRVCRSLIHLIMEYTENMRYSFIQSGYTQYANILSLKKDSSSLLKDINEATSIPLINKKADFEKLISSYEVNHDIAGKMWKLDTKATELYNCLVYNLYGTKLPNDYSTRLPIV